MGVFDYVRWDDHGKITRLQTKDFDCEMIEYRIENNRLLKDNGYYREAKWNEKLYPLAKPGEVRYFAGSIKWEHESWIDMEFHGILHGVSDEPGYPDYELKFTDGTLVNVKRIE